MEAAGAGQRVGAQLADDAVQRRGDELGDDLAEEPEAHVGRRLAVRELREPPRYRAGLRLPVRRLVVRRRLVDDGAVGLGPGGRRLELLAHVHRPEPELPAVRRREGRLQGARGPGLPAVPLRGGRPRRVAAVHGRGCGRRGDHPLTVLP